MARSWFASSLSASHSWLLIYLVIASFVGDSGDDPITRPGVHLHTGLFSDQLLQSRFFHGHCFSVLAPTA